MGGESHWPLKLPGDGLWYEVDLATNSFGQGISVTPIQMVTAIGAIANDGKMMAPHVVKAMVIDGKQYNIDPVVVGTPVSAETAHTLTTMLVNSLENEASTPLWKVTAWQAKPARVKLPHRSAIRTPPPTHPLLVGVQLMILNSGLRLAGKA